MKRFSCCIYILLSFFVVNQVQAQSHTGNEIVIEPDSPYSHGGRDITAPTATLDGHVLTLWFSEGTSSQVVIVDQSTHATVYSECFAASRCLVIDLDEEGVSAGTYTIRVYAFGKWWIGEFVLDDEE